MASSTSASCRTALWRRLDRYSDPEDRVAVVAGGANPVPLRSLRRRGAHADLIDANNTETLRVRTPLRVEQGLADTAVFPTFTQELLTDLRRRGTKVDAVERQGVDHGGIVTAGARASTSWIALRLR